MKSEGVPPRCFSEVGDGERVGVGGTAVSVADGGGVGVIVGRNGVGDGRNAVIALVGGGRTPDASSWLSRKLPSSMPTLTSVTARLPSSCPMPEVPGACPALERVCSLTVLPPPPLPALLPPPVGEGWRGGPLAAGHSHPRMTAAG